MTAEHRTEDLLLRGGVRVVGKVEDRRFEVVPTLEAGRPAAAHHDFPAVLFRERDEALTAFPLGRG